MIRSFKYGDGFLKCQIAYFWKIAECLTEWGELCSEDGRSEAGDGEHVSEKQKR